MDEFLTWVQNVFGFVDAVVLKNFIIAFGFFLLGMIVFQVFAAYIGSCIHQDIKGEYKLLESGITMIITKNSKGKDVVVFPRKITWGETFVNISVFALYKLRLMRNHNITKKAWHKALVVFSIYFAICIIIIGASIFLILTVQEPGHPYQFRSIFHFNHQ